MNSDWQAAALKALRETQRTLWQSPPVLAYLREVRGLLEDTVDHFGLGYNPAWMPLDYQSDGRPIRLPPGIVIPIFQGDELYALRVRSHVGNMARFLGIPEDDHGQKYMSLSGSQLAGTCFNIEAVTEGLDTLLVEGEFDAMLAHQELMGVACVTLGGASSQVTPEVAEKLLESRHLFVALDNDTAGFKACRSILRDLYPHTDLGWLWGAIERDGWQAWNRLSDGRHAPEVFAYSAHRVYFLSLPEGKDATDYVVERGGDLAAWFYAERLKALQHVDACDIGDDCRGMVKSWHDALLAVIRWRARRGMDDNGDIEPALWACASYLHDDEDSAATYPAFCRAEALVDELQPELYQLAATIEQPRAQVVIF